MAAQYWTAVSEGQPTEVLAEACLNGNNKATRLIVDQAPLLKE